MVEGLEVTIKYRGAKYDQVATPATASSEFAILKKDLAHLRVHSPSQRNVRRVDGSFVLHWPSAGTSPKVIGLADSLHTRWFKLCSDDPEALKLREFLSIESISMVQDGVLIRSTPGAEQASQDAPPGTLAERLGDPISEVERQPVVASAPPPAPPRILPPRVPPTGPRLDRQPPKPLKRRMSDAEGLPSQTRPRLDAPEASSTTPTETPDPQPQPQPQPPPSPKADARPASPATDDDAMVISMVISPPLEPMQDDGATPPAPAAPSLPLPAAPTPPPPEPRPAPSPTREPGEMTPSFRPPSRPLPAPYPISPASSGSDPTRRRDRDRDVSRLTRELWDTRRHLTAMQARERVLLDDLEMLGVRPEGGERHGALRDELTRVEAELKAERAKRARAERFLSDVERECRAPFVVPALFQAFMNISELSS